MNFLAERQKQNAAFFIKGGDEVESVQGAHATDLELTAFFIEKSKAKKLLHRSFS